MSQVPQENWPFFEGQVTVVYRIKIQAPDSATAQATMSNLGAIDVQSYPVDSVTVGTLVQGN